MKKRSTPQYDLPGCESVFNLALQTGADPDRIIADQLDAQRRAGEAEEYERRMQRMFEDCPGLVGCDPPRSDASTGKVVVEPARVTEAYAWLKRRFHVNENLGLSLDTGLCIEVRPRKRTKAIGRRVAVSFEKPVQFELGLDGQP
jgi:hypothetical protein